MTLRDYFAAKALQSVITSAESSGKRSGLLNTDGTPPSDMACDALAAYRYADAMLAARSK